MQFILGVFVFGEPMPPERLAGFALIWTALAIFTGEILYHRRKLGREARRLSAESALGAGRRG